MKHLLRVEWADASGDGTWFYKQIESGRLSNEEMVTTVLRIVAKSPKATGKIKGDRIIANARLLELDASETMGAVVEEITLNIERVDR